MVAANLTPILVIAFALLAKLPIYFIWPIPIAVVAPFTRLSSKFCSLASTVLPVWEVLYSRALTPYVVAPAAVPATTVVANVPHPAAAAPPDTTVVTAITGASTAPIFVYANEVL